MIITGTGFGDGATVLIGGTTALDIVVVDSTQITCTTPPHARGVVDVTVRNVDLQESTLEEAFLYIPPVWEVGDELIISDEAPGPDAEEVEETPPIIYFVLPFEGLTDGRDPRKPDSDMSPLKVSIGGDNFIRGATITFGGTPALNIVIIDKQNASCIIPPHAAGDVDVVLTNPDTGSDLERVATFPLGFTYVKPNPIISVVTPNVGTTAGDTLVSVLGKHFEAGSLISFGGLYATDVTFVNSEKMTCKTPQHFKGLVRVRVDVPDA